MPLNQSLSYYFAREALTFLFVCFPLLFLPKYYITVLDGVLWQLITIKLKRLSFSFPFSSSRLRCEHCWLSDPNVTSK